MIRGRMTLQPAMQAAERYSAICRFTQHPCYLPPGVLPNPACTRLREQTFQQIHDLMEIGRMTLEPAMSAALQTLELRRSTGDPCFLPARR